MDSQDAVRSEKPTASRVCRPCGRVYHVWEESGTVKCPHCGKNTTVATTDDLTTYPKEDIRAGDDDAREAGYDKEDRDGGKTHIDLAAEAEAAADKPDADNE